MSFSAMAFAREQPSFAMRAASVAAERRVCKSALVEWARFLNRRLRSFRVCSTCSCSEMEVSVARIVDKWCSADFAA